MKPFKFQQFSIAQSKDVFRVGTDGVLLGALSDVSEAKKVLEVGTGTGIISLMLAQRNPSAEVTAIDLDIDPAELAGRNFFNSPFAERLKVVQSDFKEFIADEKFDFIVSNPPFFEKNQSAKDVMARQRVELDFIDLIKKSAELISDNGIFSVIIPFHSGEEFVLISKGYQLHLIRKVTIYGIKNSTPKRLVLEFSKQSKPLLEEDFIIENSPRVYSEQYLELTKDFHIFNAGA